MIGKGNIVEIVVRVVCVEGAPAAISTLQALDPFAPALDRFGDIAVRCCALLRAIQRHYHDGGVVEIRIVGIVVLERPAAPADAAALLLPIASHIEQLSRS